MEYLQEGGENTGISKSGLDAPIKKIIKRLLMQPLYINHSEGDSPRCTIAIVVTVLVYSVKIQSRKED